MRERSPGEFSLSNRLASFRYAVEGIVFALRTQHNAWVHGVATLAVCAGGTWLDVSASDWRWLIACIVLVWLAELMNTAFEHVCDVVSPQLDDAVKRAKDVAAGAVLVCVLGAVAIGASVFWPYL